MMNMEPIPLLEGKSVYCINESQLKAAFHLLEKKSQSATLISQKLKEAETVMSRNERAALAFILIDRLLNNSK